MGQDSCAVSLRWTAVFAFKKNQALLVKILYFSVHALTSDWLNHAQKGTKGITKVMTFSIRLHVFDCSRNKPNFH
jgi:hypothetical protein